MIDNNRADDLPKQDEKDGISHPEARTNNRNRYGVERDQHTSEKEHRLYAGDLFPRRKAG